MRLAPGPKGGDPFLEGEFTHGRSPDGGEGKQRTVKLANLPDIILNSPGTVSEKAGTGPVSVVETDFA
jgi:hypothetical protein